MKHIFIIFVFITVKTHAVQFNVIGNLQHRNEFACNKEVILQCVVDPKTDTLVWKIGNPVLQTTDAAAECSGLTCIKNPALSSIYDFSYDENSGKSNLTISNVTLAEHGKQYECADGSTSLIFDAVVQVPPVKETTQIKNKTVAENTIITCTTGCVANKTAQLVTFKWYTIDEHGTVGIYTETTPPSSSDDSPCQINSVCISNDSVALSNNLTITQDETAEEVYFQVHILLGGDLLYSVKTNSTFRPKISDGFNNTGDCCNRVKKELIIVVAVALPVAFILIKYPLHKAEKCCESDSSVSNRNLDLNEREVMLETSMNSAKQDHYHAFPE